MRLHPEEPETPHWAELDDDRLTGQVRGMLSAQGLILVDGRSGAGKTTFAARLVGLLDGVLVHTDDLSWEHHPTDWASLLLEDVIEPWRRGERVSYRPPGWISNARPGTVEVPPKSPLIVEGVGVGRAALAACADLVVWVQSDRTIARRRGIARDIEFGRSPADAEAFWDEWMSAEEPFLAAERPWSRAALIVHGTPPTTTPGRTWLAPGPLGP